MGAANRSSFFVLTLVMELLVAVVAYSGETPAVQKSQQDVTRPSREDVNALVNAKTTGEWAYVGYNGEIILPGKTLRPSDDCYPILQRGGETVIMDSYEEWEEYARILANGRLSVSQAGRTRTGQTAAPSQWPFVDAKQGIRATANELTVLASKVVPVAERPGPKGNIGAAVLLTRDKILRLPNVSAYPENVLWILPEEDGGFRLVHSGPLYRGTYVTVTNDQEIVFGDAFVTKGSEISDQRYWPDLESRDVEHVHVYLPIGVPRSAIGQASSKFRVIWRDNEAVSTVVPHPAEL